MGIYTSNAAAAAAAALALHPNPPLREGELVRITGLTWSHVQRAIQTLRRLGLVRAIESKGYEAYELDPDGLYLSAVRRAALVDAGIAKALGPIAHRIRFGLVTGSFAWGTPTPSSDIDLLIVGGASRDEVRSLVADLATRLEREFDVIAITDEEMHERLARQDYLLSNAIANGQRIMGDPALVPTT